MRNEVQGFNTIEQFITDDGGVLLVDKFVDWTSFDVVNKIRSMFHLRKVGHAGTLDPLATGLLILCSNKMTKSIHIYQEEEKEYTGTFVLGAVTASYDTATESQNIKSVQGISDEFIRMNAQKFIGTITQIPPMYSAAKVGGKKLYELARKGKEIERKPKEITISAFNIHWTELPEIDFLVTCSKGTYIRSLVHDLGQELGCGAYLKNLRRTRIGTYNLDEAWTIDSLKEHPVN